MAKITRAIQKIFGSAAAGDEIAQIGSLRAGSINYTTDLVVMQALSQYDDGLNGIVHVSKFIPALEDINAMYFMLTTQVAYEFQEGIAEWDATTTYYKNSVVKKAGGTGGFADLYYSITDNNTNNAVTDTGNWLPLGTTVGTGASEYGLIGKATGAATTNYGVYGEASGGTTNYAGYFSGLTKVIGTASQLFQVSAAITNSLVGAVLINRTGACSTSYGLVLTQAGGTADNRGIFAETTGVGVANYGIYGQATGAGTTNYGIYGVASGATTNWAGYFGAGNVFITNRLAIGAATVLFGILSVKGSIQKTVDIESTSTVGSSSAIYGNHSGAATIAFGIAGNATSGTDFSIGVSGTAGGGGTESAGLIGTSTGTGTSGYGGRLIASGAAISNFGVYGEAADGTATNYGVFGGASGSGAVNYGGYFSATGGTTNWAGYFENGNVKIENNLEVDGLMSEATARSDSYNGMVGFGTLAGHSAWTSQGRSNAFNDAETLVVPIRIREGEILVSAKIYVSTGAAIAGTIKVYKHDHDSTTDTEIGTATINATGTFVATTNYTCETDFDVWVYINITSSSGGNYIYPIVCSIKR